MRSHFNVPFAKGYIIKIIGNSYHTAWSDHIKRLLLLFNFYSFFTATKIFQQTWHSLETFLIRQRWNNLQIVSTRTSRSTVSCVWDYFTKFFRNLWTYFCHPCRLCSLAACWACVPFSPIIPCSALLMPAQSSQMHSYNTPWLTRTTASVSHTPERKTQF